MTHKGSSYRCRCLSQTTCRWQPRTIHGCFKWKGWQRCWLGSTGFRSHLLLSIRRLSRVESSRRTPTSPHPVSDRERRRRCRHSELRFLVSIRRSDKRPLNCKRKAEKLLEQETEVTIAKTCPRSANRRKSI